MDSERAQRVMDLYFDASELAPADQPAFLEVRCEGDDALRQEIAALLRARTDEPDFLAKPIFQIGARLLADAAAGTLRPGDRLGDCVVESLLGIGGMGEVYLARDTVLGRPVAVKLIQRAQGGDLLRHFRHERQVLAGLNHPGIARLYGGAVTPQGQAYLVMEYVEGENLDEYCRARRLPVAERLALFRKVCTAVSHAHQHLVVHRDLKPANIRVTPEGEPKLLDFGIAKLLDPTATEGDGSHTVTQLGAMTRSYASPEQLRGEAITTASDVYTLGVVLYELLCGRLPFDPKRRDADQAAPRTGTVAPTAAIADERGTTPARLGRQLAGDLDNIVRLALRPEPARRYPSVSQFSDDLRRHGEGLPVTARPDTFTYRTGKFVRRHKTGVAVGALTILALITALIVTTWQAKVALRERDRAGVAQRQAERLNGFLEKLLGSADPSRMGKDVKVADVLDAAGQTLDRELAGEPEVLIHAHRTLARSYFHLGLLVPAEKQARAALDLERPLHGADDPATVKAEIDLANILVDRKLPVEAESLLRHALTMLRQASIPDHAQLALVLGMLGHCFTVEERADEAVPLISEALEHARTAWGEQSKDYGQILNALGSVKNGQKKFAEAESIYRRVLAIQDQLAPTGERSITPLFNLCISLFNQGKFAEMRLWLDRAERDTRRLYGGTSVYYGLAIYTQGIVDAETDRLQTAIPRFQEALPLLVASYLPDFLSVVMCKAELGLCLTRTGRAAEGEPLLRAALADGGKLDRSYFEYTFGNLETALGECLLAQKRYAEAERLLLTGHDDLEKRLGARSHQTLRSDSLLHDLYVAWEKPDQAARYIHARAEADIPRSR